MATPDVNYSAVATEANPFIGHNDAPQDDGLVTDSDYDDIPQNRGIMIHVVPESSKSRWNHIEDLDSFFTRMYNYHQKHGFYVMMLQEIFELGQFVFVVIFVTYLVHCINYPVLFREYPMNQTTKVTLDDVTYPLGTCVSSIPAASWVILFLAMLFWQIRTIQVICHVLQYYDIKKFYNSALKIEDSEIDNLTWHEVQRKILEVQSEQQMCIHKEQLTELDIYHRILRFKNYMVAMMNKNLLPSKICVPFIGESVCYSRGLRYNIEMILFRGPWSAFKNNWDLKDEFKKQQNRQELSQKLSRQIFWVAFGNLLLSPLVFLWSLMVFFFNYADLIKREPSKLGTRCWSQYGMLYMRHLNELDHELHARLNRAYRPADKYMSSFSSPLMAVIARNVIFIGGGPLAILMLLTIYDEDVVQVEHVLLLMSILGAMVVIARVFIPNENLIWCPEKLMTAVLMYAHYLPVSWRGQAHTSRVRDQFGHFFQLRVMYLITELLSPITTPLVLMFHLRPRSLDIVDFFRHFTVSVVGVGDVCSFAQMDMRKHGNPDWQPTHSTDDSTNQYTQGENGKTELSLVHFAYMNPGCKLPEKTKEFMADIQNNIDRTKILANTAMENSVFSAGSMGGEQSHNLLGTQNQMGLPSFQSHSGYGESRNPFSSTTNYPHDHSIDTPHVSIINPRHIISLANIDEDEETIRPAEDTRPAYYERTTQSILGASMGMSMIGAMNRHEGPPNASIDGLLSSYGTSGIPATEHTITDMSLSTLYLHEFHHRQIRRRMGTIRANQEKSWQHPHQTASMDSTSAGIAFSQPSTSASVAAERTPLLAPKKS